MLPCAIRPWVVTSHRLRAADRRRRAPTAIVAEPEAGNTLENVRFRLAAPRRAGRAATSALLVAKGFVTRRAVATFAAQAPAVRVGACPPVACLEEAMDRNPDAFPARLAAEIERLDRCGARGDITPQRIPRAVREAARQIRTPGFRK